ncbi:unnamed protein product [Jaminaea pallidilutea]
MPIILLCLSIANNPPRNMKRCLLAPVHRCCLSEAGPSRYASIPAAAVAPSSLVRLPPRQYVAAPQPLFTGQRFASTKPTQSKKEIVPDGKPTDERIGMNAMVRQVDSETGRLQQEPRRVRDILASLDRSAYFLEQVTPAFADKDGSNERLAVCKVVSKRESYRAYKARKSAASATKSAGSNAQSTVQLTWLTTDNDLRHKVGRSRKSLFKNGRGAQVEWDIVTKKAKGAASGSKSDKEKVLERLEELMVAEPEDSDQHQDQDQNQGEAGENEAKQGKGKQGKIVRIRRRGEPEWDGDHRCRLTYEAYIK